MFESDVMKQVYTCLITSYVCCHTRHCHITTLKDIYKYLDFFSFYQFTQHLGNPALCLYGIILILVVKGPIDNVLNINKGPPSRKILRI